MDIIERVCDRFKRYEQVIIFGASSYGKIAHGILKDRVGIIAFCDNDKKKQGTQFCGAKVIAPEELTEHGGSAVLIASMYSGEISYQLSQMGIENFFVFFAYVNNSIGTARQQLSYKINEPLNVEDYTKITVCEEMRRKNLSDFSNFLRKDAKRPRVTISTKEINYYNDKNKNILFIIAHFPPMGGAGIQRNSKYVKYLKRMGYNPIVITWGDYCTEGGYRMRDESLLKDIPEDITVIRVDHTYSWGDNLTETELAEACAVIDGIIDDDSIMNRFLEDMRDYNKEGHRLGVFFMPWTANALSTLENFLDYKRIGAFYSSAPPYDSHFIGFYLKCKYGLPWVSDFRDEWSNSPSVDKLYEVERAIEAGLAEKADAIVTLNDIMAENCYETFSIPKEKVFMIANGYDEEDFSNIGAIADKRDDERKFTIKYVGYIYLKLDPIHEFISVINELVDEGSIDSSKIQILVTGNNDIETEATIKGLDKHDIFSMFPYVPHGEGIKNMLSADVLLLFGRVGKSIYTGKIFEYIRTGVPIFAVGDGGGGVEDVIASTNTGVFFDRADSEGIKKALIKMYCEFYGKGISLNPNRNEIRKYSREFLARKLTDVFEYVMKNPSREDV